MEVPSELKPDLHKALLGPLSMAGEGCFMAIFSPTWTLCETSHGACTGKVKLGSQCHRQSVR